MKTLIITAHPDDAELALGGTIAYLISMGCRVTVAIATVSESNGEIRKKRILAAEQAAKILGHNIIWLASGDYDQVEDIPQYHLISIIDKLVEDLNPTIIMTHCETDSHYDHVKLSKAVTSSSRRWPTKSLFQFGPNELRTHKFVEFCPNTFVPIDRFLEQKMKALRCYEYLGQGFRRLDYDSVEREAKHQGARLGLGAVEALNMISQVGIFDPLGINQTFGNDGAGNE